MDHFTIRAVLWSYQSSKSGLYPIKIALTRNRKVTYILTPHRVGLKQFKDGRVTKDHPNANLINADLQRRINELNKEIIVRDLEGLPVTRRSLINKSSDNDKSFVKYAREIRDNAKELNRLIAFAGESFSLRDVDVAFLRKYEQHEKDRGIAQNTRNTTFKYLRRILRQAKAEGLIKDNPIDAYAIPKYVQSERLFLLDKEREKFLKLLDNKAIEGTLYSTLVYFLLGCYTGLRHSDWMQFNEEKMVDGEFLRLRPKKTAGTSGDFVVLPIGKTLRKIIELIRPLPKPLSNQKSNEKLKLLAILAGVKKDVTTHTGRHSFGYICASRGLPKSTTAELMGITVDTVEVYYHLSGEDIAKQAAILRTL